MKADGRPIESARVHTTNLVDCKGCGSLCCKGDKIVLHPREGDDPSLYLTEPTLHDLTGERVLMLQHADNGDCVYLGAKGCTIYDRRPVICREFDCALSFMKMTKVQRREAVRRGWVDPAVIARGKKLAIARGLM